MESVLLVVRVGLSLAAVLTLMWWLSRRFGSTATRAARDTLTIVGRQQLTRRTGVAVVEAEGRRLVVGYSETGVTLMHDAGPAPEPELDAAPESRVELDIDSLSDSLSDSPSNLGRSASTVDEPGPMPAVDGDPVRSTSARTAAVRRFRMPLEGSILVPVTWRKAVAAVQERTTRRT